MLVEAAVAAVVLWAGGATVLALLLRARLRAAQLAARVAHERDAAFVAALRRLGEAALRSVADVRAEIDAAVGRIGPAIDCLLLFDEESGELACTFARGARVAYFAGARIARTDASLLPPRALRVGHRVGLGEGARSFHPADAFALAVPLRCDDGRASVLYVAAPVAVDEATVEAIVTLADHAAFCYALAHGREADRRHAEYDALTGLLTPRAFRERLSDLIERARFTPRARLALLFVDTDHFKAWNDTYGHASGDALLRTIARTVRGAAGSADFAARNGGDEFCVVFADAEKSAAIARAQALRAAIAALDFAALRPPAAPAGVSVTASIGVAAFPADASSAQELLERADAAMYAVKRAGRDGVAFAGTDGVPVRADAPAVATP